VRIVFGERKVVAGDAVLALADNRFFGAVVDSTHSFSNL
jgi:hypothetical protein